MLFLAPLQLLTTLLTRLGLQCLALVAFPSIIQGHLFFLLSYGCLEHLPFHCIFPFPFFFFFTFPNYSLTVVLHVPPPILHFAVSLWTPSTLFSFSDLCISLSFCLSCDPLNILSCCHFSGLHFKATPSSHCPHGGCDLYLRHLELFPPKFHLLEKCALRGL